MPAANEDRGGDRPAEHEREHEAEREQVHPADEHGGQREGKGGSDGCSGGEATPARTVLVEGHHHEAEEDHGRDRADPVEVDRGHAVLRAVRRHAEYLECAKVRGDERQAGDPRRQ
jgi:hypothetical protein